MASLNLISFLDEVFVPGILFSVLHSLNNAYIIKQSSPINSTLVRLAIATICLSMGGGIITSLILGKPQAIFFSPKIIPIYSLSAVLMALSPTLFNFVDSIPTSLRTPYFNLIDALSRGYAMPKFLLMLRSMKLNSSLASGDAVVITASFAGQFILSTLSITGGGIIYQWVFQNNPWRIGGWSFSCIMIVCMLNLIYFEMLEIHSNPNNPLYTFRLFLEGNGILPGIQELKFISFLLIFVGLLTVPSKTKTGTKVPMKEKEKEHDLASKVDETTKEEVEEEVEEPVVTKRRGRGSSSTKESAPKSRTSTPATTKTRTRSSKKQE